MQRLVVGARHRERHEDVAGLGNRRVGQQAHDVGLAQGDEVADGHRERRQHPEHRTPHVGTAEEADVDQEQEGDEPARLRRHRQERGHRRRRTLVGVGRPEVEGHGRNLESEANGDEEDAERHKGGVGDLALGGLADIG